MEGLGRTPGCFTVGKMIALLLGVWLLCLPFYSSANRNVETNDRPIIGILAQEVHNPTPDKTAYIAASYVKFAESAGARVVPVMINQTLEEYKTLFNSINGILYPGGGASIISSGYQRAAKAFYDLAIEANKRGDYFPVWGTCLGLEQLTYLTSGQALLSNTNTSGVSLPLNFTDGHIGSVRADAYRVLTYRCDKSDWITRRRQGGQESFKIQFGKQIRFERKAKGSRMFKGFPAELMEDLASEALTENSHMWSLAVLTYNTNEELKKFYKVLSTNSDGRVEFVSTVEAYDYPIYGTQWHPEKNAFEWTRPYIPHSSSAVKTTFYTAEFFVSEARKNLHRFESEEDEERALIYNYSPVNTGSTGIFEQVYYF